MIMGENGATIAAIVCMTANGIAPASAPANAVKGRSAVAQRPLDMHRRVNRLTTVSGTLGGCLVMRRRTEAAPTDDAAESRLRFAAAGAGTRRGAFGFFHSHSFLHILFTGNCKKNCNIVILVPIR